MAVEPIRPQELIEVEVPDNVINYINAILRERLIYDECTIRLGELLEELCSMNNLQEGPIARYLQIIDLYQKVGWIVTYSDQKFKFRRPEIPLD